MKRGRIGAPVFAHNFPGSHHLDELVVDVALRSAAAPTVFPSHQGHIDGGMVANNPSTVAIAMALGHKTPRPALEDIRVLSIGTGLTPTIISLRHNELGNHSMAAQSVPETSNSASEHSV